MTKNKCGKEEKNWLFLGMLVGILGSFAGSMFITSMYRMMDKGYSYHNIVLFIAALIIFFIVVIFLYTKIET